MSSQNNHSIYNKLNPVIWQKLEQSATRAVLAGGMSAMAHYRQKFALPDGVAASELDKKNRSIQADFEATAEILKSITADLKPIAKHLRCSLEILAEETRLMSWGRKHLPPSVFRLVRSPEAFFTAENNRMRVIVDGIDGTGSFERGIPLFCTALAILIDEQPRVSAVYDPIHHIVYSATLRGGNDHPSEISSATCWQIATGTRINLVERNKASERLGIEKEAIGFHLTRSSDVKLEEFLRPGATDQGILERISKLAGATYAINSGILALVYVAEGALGGFVNISTNLWDVAPGEPLVRACGGSITGFDGKPVDYSSTQQVSVVAAKGHLHARLLECVKC